MLVPAVELARISSLLNRVSSQASVASIAGLGSYVGKGPTAASDSDENIEGRMREEGGDAEGRIARTYKEDQHQRQLLRTPVPAV